jgi:peptidoglycan-associated lipoprotein
MIKKGLSIFVLILCAGFLLSGCAKKTLVKEQPSAQTAQDLAAERDKAAKAEADRAARDRAAKEAAIREEEAKRALAQKQKDLEKSLVAKKQPGIEGEFYESSQLKDVHFDFDKYDIGPKGAEILKEDAVILQKLPNAKIQVEGHCDERGTNEYNLALGERRANSTKKYLVSLGISAGRISTISYGEEKPLDPGHNEEAWAKNRRGHIIILSK